jgi:hypothetical protein
VDTPEAGPLHEGDARAHRSEQEKPRSLRHNEVDESEVLAVAQRKVEVVIGQAFFRQTQELEEEDCRQDCDHLFAQEKSKLELKDEQSS